MRVGLVEFSIVSFLWVMIVKSDVDLTVRAEVKD